MKFEVYATPNSKLIVEADPSGQGPIKVCAREVDLSGHDLFVQPLSVPGDESIECLKDKAIEVFRLLAFGDLSKPLLGALGNYYENRLPNVLRQLEAEIPDSQPVLEESLAILTQDPTRSQQVLARIVERVDAEFPYAYRTEKALGTYPWLSSGGNAPLPFLLAPRSSICRYHSLFVPAKPIKDYVPFAIDEGVAFYPDESPPTPAAILASLCETGSPGGSVDFLNQAAAKSMMTKSISHDIELARRSIEEQRGLISPAQRSFLGYSSVNLLLSVLGATCTAQAIIGTMDMGLGLSHIALGAVGGTLGMFAWTSQRAALTVRNRRRERDTQKLEDARTTIQQTRIVPHSVLSTVLLDHLSRGDVSTKRSFPAPESEIKWRAVFDSIVVPDHRTRRHLTVVPKDPKQSHPDINRHLKDRIIKALQHEGTYLQHVEAAQQYSQLLLAIDTANFFTELMGMRGSLQTQLPLRQLFSHAQHSRAERDESFGLISHTFKNLCHSLRLSSEDWAFASRPLYAVYLLESELALREAKKIAIEEVLKG